jgi:hypothetical protein
MAFDPQLDKSFVDFEKELHEIQGGKNDMKKSNLYWFLKADIQKNIDKSTLSEGVAILKREYGVFTPFWNNLPKYYYTKTRMSNLINSIEEREKLAKMAFARRDWISYNKATSHGLSTLISLTMMLTFKRFHKLFGMNDFLLCWIRIDDEEMTGPDQIFQQLMASRINFILHGEYLPILIYMADETHAIGQMIMPVLSEDGTQTWYVIDVNSNGEAQYLKYMKFIDLSLQKYEDWTSPQIQNKMQRMNSVCWENIQKEHGTCGYWSTILIFQFYADFSRMYGPENDLSIDKIDIFCKALSERTAYYVIINRFNNYFVDLGYSFRHFIKEIYQQFENPPLIQEFGTMVLQGPVSRTVLLDFAIFQNVEKIRNNLRKYLEKAAKRKEQKEEIVSFEYETEEESPRSTQRRQELTAQKQEKLRIQEERDKRATRKERDFKKYKDEQPIRNLFDEIHPYISSWKAGRLDEYNVIDIKDYLSKFVNLLKPDDISENGLPTRDYLKRWFLSENTRFRQSMNDDISECNDNIELYKKDIYDGKEMLKADPDAPRIYHFPDDPKLTLADDIEKAKSMLMTEENKLKELRERYDELLQDDLKIDKEIDEFLSFAETFMGASKKHKRDWE